MTLVDHVCRARIMGGLNQPRKVDHDIGTGERGSEIIGCHVGADPADLLHRLRRAAAGDANDRFDRGVVAQRRQHGRAQVAGRSGHGDAHEITSSPKLLWLPTLQPCETQPATNIQR